MLDFMNLVIRLCQVAIIYIVICEITYDTAENCPSWNYRKFLDD